MEMGFLRVESYPTGAKIFIDNVLVLDGTGMPGLTPAMLTLSVGYHDIKLELGGYCNEYDGQYIMKETCVEIFHNFNIC